MTGAQALRMDLRRLQFTSTDKTTVKASRAHDGSAGSAHGFEAATVYKYR
jgi:hypothetical protein